ncbi:MAG: domain S-box-containing protein, partial [Verrucomicrobiales bacterium]|nr:domain S-box-containing protein [Verrucomicrobiales bacterium]
PGYKPTLAEGLDCYPPECREQVVRYVENCARDGTPYDFELPKITLKGRRIWVRSIGEAVRDADGKIIRLQGAFQDITDRKKAQESLQLLSSAVEQSKESILITDARLDFPGPAIIFANPAFTRMTGYTAVEVIGKTPRILQGPRTDREMMQRLRDTLKVGEVFQGETYNYRKDGSEFLLEWQIAPIRNSSGELTHFVAIQRDITLRKRLEAQLFQSQKLETVGKLAGGIAHEFNGIMTIVIGHVEMILNDLPATDPLRENASEIYKAANRVAALTRQLLAYGRKQILQPQLLDLNTVITNMEGVIRHFVGGKSELRVLMMPNLKSVKADAGKIEQVIMNLVMNAVDSLSGGGRVTIETANVSLAEDSLDQVPELNPGHYVTLSITDNGAGISEKAKAHLFEPFFTTKQIGKGTGMGLASSHGIIRQSGGHIAVTSKLGEGSTFKIFLPQVEAAPEMN